jgi:hypothetical protein
MTKTRTLTLDAAYIRRILSVAYNAHDPSAPGDCVIAMSTDEIIALARLALKGLKGAKDGK